MTTSNLPTWFTYARLKTITFNAHRWLGLTAGILLCIAGVTGSVLVFGHEIDRAILGSPWRSCHLPPCDG